MTRIEYERDDRKADGRDPGRTRPPPEGTTNPHHAVAPEHAVKGQWLGEETFRMVWDTAVDAMVLSDPDGIVVAANPAYLRLYGFEKAKVLGESFAIIFPEEWRESALIEYRRMFEGSVTAPSVESIVKRADGEERTVDVRYNVIERDGRRVAMLSVIRDVTEKVRLQRAEQNHLRHKDDFLLAVSHDLKTPVAGIMGHAQLLLRSLNRPEGADRERLERGLRTIEATAKRMNNLIGELVDAASIEMDQPIALHCSDVDLVACADRAVQATQQTTSTHDMHLESPPDPVVGWWDGGRLERVLDNLLSNAVKYSPSGGPITVSVSREERDGEAWAVLRVTDSGIGIAEGDVHRIFDRFYRAEHANRTIMGVGIGLSGVCRIVEEHGGTITVESVEGSGSTFTVRLPIRRMDDVDP